MDNILIVGDKVTYEETEVTKKSASIKYVKDRKATLEAELIEINKLNDAIIGGKSHG